MPAAVLDERPGAMPADIVKSLERALLVADHEQRPARDGLGQIVAGPLQLARMPDQQPFAAEDRLALGGERGGLVIARCAEGCLGERAGH